MSSAGKEEKTDHQDLAAQGAPPTSLKASPGSLLEM